MVSRNIYVDLGLGVLVRSWCYKFDFRKLDVIFVFYRYVDYCNDFEVMVEVMIGGVLKKRGVLIVLKSVVYGDEEYMLVIS